MGPIYATVLMVRADTAHPVEQQFETVVERCRAWMLRDVRGSARSGDLLPDDDCFLGDHAEWAHAQRDEITGMTPVVRFDRLHNDRHTAWRGVAAYMPIVGSDLRKRVEIQVATEETLVEIRIRVLIGAEIPVLRPLNYAVVPPAIVYELIETFGANCYAGASRATIEPEYLGNGDDVQRLIDRLKLPERFKPILVFSRLDSGKLACAKEIVAEAAWMLAGIGAVVVLPNASSSRRLNDRLGEDLSCTGGAARLYWPELSQWDDEPDRHPVWAADALSGRTFLREVFRRVAAASALSIGASETVWEMVRVHERQMLADAVAHEQHLRDELHRVLGEVDQVGELTRNERAEEIRALEDALADAAARVAQADRAAQAKTEEAGYFAQEHDRKQASLIHTQGELAEMKASFSELEEELHAHREDAFGMARAIANVRTLEAAVGIFAGLCDASELLLLADVHSSAAESGFRWPLRNPDMVWASFDRLLRAARHFHQGSTLKEALELAGVTPDDWAARVSDTAVSMYPERYRKSYQDIDGATVNIVLGPHLKVGGKGNRGDAFRIYWSLENHAVYGPRFVVGHIGAKLKDSTGGY